uniref:Glyco_hydro_35 domain-containing protein n=1 Tax=Rhodnius prolixus TaxID=13249 RepID=T1I5G8_RHOPR
MPSFPEAEAISKSPSITRRECLSTVSKEPPSSSSGFDSDIFGSTLDFYQSFTGGKSVHCTEKYIRPEFSLKRIFLTEKREFIIDYDTNEFMMDGEPFTYASGELHYFRVPQPYWRDRMRKYRYAGLNAISTYIEWSLHEPSPNRFVFDGEANITEFIKIAQEEDLYVIVRPGPYICAERDFGGYPAWLLSINPKMKLRTSDPYAFMPLSNPEYSRDECGSFLYYPLKYRRKSDDENSSLLVADSSSYDSE